MILYNTQYIKPQMEPQIGKNPIYPVFVAIFTHLWLSPTFQVEKATNSRLGSVSVPRAWRVLKLLYSTYGIQKR